MSGTTVAAGPPIVGATEWLRVNEYERAERLIADLGALGVRHLRTQLSWADWHVPDGPRWYRWLFPRLAEHFELLPCVMYTPPSLGVEAKTSAPPRNPKDYADFLDHALDQVGDHFEWLELWNEPNNLVEWDWRLDPEWDLFCRMMGMAAHWARRRGYRTVLPGTAPTDAYWLSLMCERGLLAEFDAVGIHGFPGIWDVDWRGWREPVEAVRQVLARWELAPDIWITEGGYSTWRHDEFQQVRQFLDLSQAPVSRAYWYAVHDLDPHASHQGGFHQDERHYHFGLKRDSGEPKLLFHLWRDSGVAGVARLVERHRTCGAGISPELAGGALERSRPDRRPVLITGGAGFVGTNLAARLAAAGEPVLILDSLARPGVTRNLDWLCDRFPRHIRFEVADMRDRYVVQEAVSRAGFVYHLAAQVAVTTSFDDPTHDFDVNLGGTVNLLEALRRLEEPPPAVFTSTNKVYGELGDLPLRREGPRYRPEDEAIAARGVDEWQRLDFHSPYGCSKGGADQYVRDYARSFGLATVVLRMSCIYGPHQLGTEDQGWVAHFLLRALENRPITIFGDGRQVRDVLYVDDLVTALCRIRARMPSIRGQVFNMGGGPGNAVSLLGVIDLIEALGHSRPTLDFQPWRPGDQKFYVSDIGKARERLGWEPTVAVGEGVSRLYRWLREQQEHKEVSCTQRYSRVPTA